MKPLLAFTVSHRALKLKVKVMPQLRNVGAMYRSNRIQSTINPRGMTIHAFFEEASSRSKYLGTIVLCQKTSLSLFEVVPHEVTHACIHHFKAVDEDDDEAFATAVGSLSAKILKKIIGEIGE